MIEQDIYLESVRERDIDLLLIEELHVAEAFQQFIFKSLILQHETVRFVGAWHSVSTHNGESDVIVIYRDGDGKRIAILIENKINASVQYRQSERYIERGNEGIQNDIWDEFVTCLFAPQSYLNNDQQNYHTTLSYEAVQQFFIEVKSKRADYKSQVIEAAIDHQRRSKQREVNESSTLFAHKYILYIQKQYPDLLIKEELQGRALGHSWFYFYPFSEPSVYLVHQCANGNVGLTIQDKRLTTKKQEIEDLINRFQIQGIKLNIGKGSVSFLFKSPKIHHTEADFEDWIEDIDFSVGRMLRIKHIYKTLLKDELVKLL